MAVIPFLFRNFFKSVALFFPSAVKGGSVLVIEAESLMAFSACLTI
jgi:hypothetical protein